MAKLEIGDHVRFTRGVYKGAEGLVVHTLGKMSLSVHLFAPKSITCPIVVKPRRTSLTRLINSVLVGDSLHVYGKVRQVTKVTNLVYVCNLDLVYKVHAVLVVEANSRAGMVAAKAYRCLRISSVCSDIDSESDEEEEEVAVKEDVAAPTSMTQHASIMSQEGFKFDNLECLQALFSADKKVLVVVDVDPDVNHVDTGAVTYTVDLDGDNSFSNIAVFVQATARRMEDAVQRCVASGMPQKVDYRISQSTFDYELTVKPVQKKVVLYQVRIRTLVFRLYCYSHPHFCLPLFVLQVNKQTGRWIQVRREAKAASDCDPLELILEKTRGSGTFSSQTVFPPYYAICKEYRTSHVKIIQSGHLLYNQVLSVLQDLDGGAYLSRLKKVSVIINPYRYYHYRHTTVYDKSPGKEEFVVHGTEGSSVPGVISNGFDRSFNKGSASGRSRMGIGTYTARKMYFSMDNSYSPPDSKGDKHIFLCRAYPGKIASELSAGVCSTNHYAPPGFSSVESGDKVILVLYQDVRVIPEFHLVFSS
jgi:hypothetical protein